MSKLREVTSRRQLADDIEGKIKTAEDAWQRGMETLPQLPLEAVPLPGEEPSMAVTAAAKEMLAAAESGLRISPLSDGLLWLRARALFSLGRRDEAEAALRVMLNTRLELQRPGVLLRVARGETLEGNFPAAQATLMGKELLEKGLETEMGRPPGKQLDPEELKKEIEGVKADVKTHVK